MILFSLAVTDSGLSKFDVGLIGAGVGAVVGAGVVLLVVAVVCDVCFCKKTHAPVQQNVSITNSLFNKTHEIYCVYNF